MNSRGAIRVESVEAARDFEAMREEWSELLASSSSDHFFLTWEWLFTWWRHLSAGRRLRILAARSGGRLMGIAPLARRPPVVTRILPFAALEFLGSGSVGSDYLDLILRRGAEEDVLAAMAQHLAAGRDILDLSRLRPAGSHAAALAARLADGSWSPVRTSAGTCPFIPLSGRSWEEYLASLGAVHRYNFRRRIRGLEKRFDVTFAPVRSEEERREALRLLVELHLKRRAERGGSDAFHRPELIAFHDEFSRLALQRGWLRLFILRLDGRAAGALYGFRYGDTFSFYQSGFDPAYRKLSVGLVTLGLSIRSALEEGAREYDLLHGDEAYKFHWARESRELERLEVFPRSVGGGLWRRLVLLRRAARRLVPAPSPAGRIREAAP